MNAPTNLQDPEVRDERGLTRRGEFGESTSMAAETASSAGAAQAAAMVQARYVMAMRNPRSWDETRVRLMRECKRPGFAEVAGYSKPIGNGKTVEGLSIRFAEAALRCMTNVQISAFTIFDDAKFRIVRVVVSDLEANVPYEVDVTVAKTIERSSVRDGQTVLSVRKNSAGRDTYLIEASDDELLVKQSALISKAIRVLALRLLPGDIQDDCRSALIATVQGNVKADPAAAKKKVLDGFAEISVFPKDVEAWLGHSIEQVTEGELVELRRVYTGIRDSETTWAECLAARVEERAAKNEKRDPKSPLPPPVAGAAPKAAKLDKLAGAAKPATTAAAPAAAPYVADEPDDFRAALDGAAPSDEQAADAARAKLLDDVRAAHKGLAAELVESAYLGARLSPEVVIEEIGDESLQRLLAALKSARAAHMQVTAKAPAPTLAPAAAAIPSTVAPLAQQSFDVVVGIATRVLGQAHLSTLVEMHGGKRGKVRYALDDEKVEQLRLALINAIEAKQAGS